MDELILINKPPGMTSHDVVDAVRRVYKTRRVGHAGTLDPFATGLLIVGIGSATKKLGEVSSLPKTYEATARLGATSTTGDPEGIIVPYTPPNLPSKRGGNRYDFSPSGEGELEGVLQKFVGTIQQTPPMYSAKKIGGKKLYELARRGKVVERQPVTVTIHSLKLTTYNLELKTLAFTAAVSSGTYIRTLAEDIGAALGCGAYLIELKRTAIGPYRLEDAVNLADLKSPS